MSRQSTPCAVLVGRKDEVELLKGAIENASAGMGGVILVTGEAGIGKSRLAREAASPASGRGFECFRAERSSMEPRQPPSGADRGAFGAIREGGLPDAPELRPFRSALARIVPELGEEAVKAAIVKAIAASLPIRMTIESRTL